MEQINLKSSANRTKSINKLVEKINSTVDALIDTLTLSPQSVWNFGISVSQTIDSEFTDRVVKNLWILKNHLKDIQGNLDLTDLNNERLEEITQSLTETSDQLNTLAGSNNYFYNTFGWAVQEINVMIDKILSKLPVWAYSYVATA